MTIVVHLQPGETIVQALYRARLIALSKENETIVIPPGVVIVGSNSRQTRINPSLGFGKS